MAVECMGAGVTNSIVWPDGVENAATAFCLMVEDPHFRDEAGFDYRLQSDSPCVEAGATVWAAGMQDLYGNPTNHLSAGGYRCL